MDDNVLADQLDEIKAMLNVLIAIENQRWAKETERTEEEARTIRERMKAACLQDIKLESRRG
jgi:hypothetical protein